MRRPPDPAADEVPPTEARTARPPEPAPPAEPAPSAASGADLLEPPQAPVPPWRRGIRYWATKTVVHVGVRCLVRLRLEGLDRLPPGPSLLCANHQSWADPIVAFAALPGRPRLFFFGPKEEDMTAGGRNRLMLWTGTAVPFKPAKSDLRETARRVAAVFDAGHRLLIFGEGRIHAREGELLPLQDGAVWLATRSKVPIVPVAIVGTSWLGFGRTIRVRIGEPIVTEGCGGRDGLEALTAATWCALYRLSQGAPEKPLPGRLGRWLTEAFNDWPEGERPAETPGAIGPAAQGRDTIPDARPGTAAGEPVVGPHGPCPPP